MKRISIINSSRRSHRILSAVLQSLEQRGFYFTHSLFSRARVLVLCQRPEKIFLTLPGRLLGKRVIWLQLPGETRKPANGLFSWLYTRSQRSAEVVTFAQQEVSGKSKAEHRVLPATLPEPPREYQEDLFTALADRPRRRFVAASIIHGLDKRLVERLLSALAATLPVCPIMELLIIGEGEDRKQLQWLVRRMELTNRVWLVGGSETPSRWLEDANVYIVAEDYPALEPMAAAIIAMRCGLPVLADIKSGLGGIVTSKTGALIDLNDAETVARQLVRLEQEADLCKDMGAEAKALAGDLTFERLVSDVAAIFSHGI